MNHEVQHDYLPYGRQTITQADIDSVVQTLNSPFLTQGPVVPQFEKSVADKVGARYGVACNSATSALHVACMAFGLTKGSILWTSPITFVASSNCALYCGASVDFIDINPATGLLDISKLKEKLIHARESECLPDVVVPVHLGGTSCDMESIYELSRDFGFYVLEDASHAIGGKYNDSYVGSCKYSDACIFSFHPVKIITSGEGGMLLTNNQSIAKASSLLRSHGITKDSSAFQYPSTNPWYYEQQSLGFNYRLTDIQAALGLSQLERLDDIVSRRHQIFEYYCSALRDFKGVSLLDIPENSYSSFHLVVLQVDTSIYKHDSVFKCLRSLGIGVQLHYLPVHLQPYYQNLGFKNGDFPHSEHYAKSSFSLPVYPGLTRDDLAHVVESLKVALENSRSDS